jgi:protein-L-isoaspartate(D-aspartate) O-methyltransferase
VVEITNPGYDSLIDGLEERGVLRTPELVDAFRAVDRRDFVGSDQEAAAYLDTALPIGLGQTISQPYTVAFMLELLQPRAGDKILDVGFGSGWQTALLAHVVGGTGRVVGLEIIPELCEIGRTNVAKYNFIEKGIAATHCMSALGGFPNQAPFDKIIAAAAGETVPNAWQEQLKVGGRIVTPVGSSILLLEKPGEDKWQRTDYPGFAFVPLVNS